MFTITHFANKPNTLYWVSRTLTGGKKASVDILYVSLPFCECQSQVTEITTARNPAWHENMKLSIIWDCSNTVNVISKGKVRIVTRNQRPKVEDYVIAFHSGRISLWLSKLTSLLNDKIIKWINKCINKLKAIQRALSCLPDVCNL